MAANQDVSAPTTWSLVVSDLEHMVKGRSRSRAMWWVEVALRVALVPRVRAVCLFRLSQVAVRRRAMPIALLLGGRTQRGSGAEISPSATIGPGLCLMHSTGIVIGPDVTIGRGARLYQGITLGDGQRPGQPTIGDHVTIGAGAWVLGGVTIGDRVIIGAGALVTGDLPDDAVAAAPSGAYKLRRPGVNPRLDRLAGWTAPEPVAQPGSRVANLTTSPVPRQLGREDARLVPRDMVADGSGATD